MKLLFSFLLAGCFAITAFTQNKIPAFGKVDKADLEMKDCSFEPGADASILIDLGEVEFSYYSEWQSQLKGRVRIKILKESGLKWAQVKLPYYSKNRYEEISGVQGISYYLDASGNINETKLEKSSVYDKPADKDHGEISFALPNVKIGTVFEYRYTRIRKSFSSIPTWYFQESIPVQYSAYNIQIPEYFQFTEFNVKRQEMVKKADKVNGTSGFENAYSYTMKNIPGLKEEPFSAGTRDYIQRVEFQLSRIQSPNFYREYRTTWPKIIDELLDDEDFGIELKKNLKLPAELALVQSSGLSITEKIRQVYKYVQQNMLWDQQYGLYSVNGIKNAWDKKTGSIADIDLILVKLLREAGVEAKPLLASTKDHGEINTIFPFLNQFNCVMAYVKEGENIYVMNAADKYNPYDLIPYDVLYATALVVDKKEGGLIELNSNKKYAVTVFLTAMVEAGEKISGEASLSSSGYARNIKMNTINKGKMKAELEAETGINIQIDSSSLNNEKDELAPLEQKNYFKGSLQSSGEYVFLPLTLFSGIGKNEFIAEDRVTDIDFSFPKSYVVSGSYILPENYSVNALPRNIKMIMPDTSIVLTRVVQQSENTINFRFTLDLKAPEYRAEGYPFIKEFFKKMFDLLDERIVLKKK